ncbi:hypothetical protein [Paenibacillus elgii]|uniref:hypothetical protein n=1 Tax=Paenibacillus elgii TaxID=189691 RepID=UPI0013D85385|nr:hypothetical protein [Paenibacillus elgii]
MVKKKKLFGLLIACVIFLVIMTLSIKYIYYSHHKSNSINRLDLLPEKLEISSLNQNDVQRVLHKSYINNQKTKYFSSYGVQFPYPKPYIMYWSLYLKNKLHYETNDLDRDRYTTLLSSSKFLDDSNDFGSLIIKSESLRS